VDSTWQGMRVPVEELYNRMRKRPSCIVQALLFTPPIHLKNTLPSLFDVFHPDKEHLYSSSGDFVTLQEKDLS
jgi:hypothetical protein